MPVRWTPENDQVLLLKILETHEISINAQGVADSWPTGEDGKGEKPTPRAITERIFKLKSLAKANGTADINISVASRDGTSPATAKAKKPATPRKPRATKDPATPSGATSEKRKRAKKVVAVKAETDDAVNDEMVDDEVVDDEESPSKKVKPSQEMHGEVEYGTGLDGAYEVFA